MTGRALVRVIATATGLAATAAASAFALPTMVRLGYTGCAACHLAAQGGGPLNDYGRGIDEAQSLRAGEYRADDQRRRLTHDVRLVIQQSSLWAAGASGVNTFRPRLMYRNVTAITNAFRVSGVVTAEGAAARRPARSYDPAARDSAAFVNTALVHYQPHETLEIAAGRDQLPSGINVPDLVPYIKSRNRLGYYDSPTQVKAYWWGKRHHVSPFVYGPGGNEMPGEGESGGGTLAEFDLLANQRTVIGTTVVKGAARNGTRQMVGAYARLGFGPWGILAEHDVTARTRTDAAAASFRQSATYAQVFWAAREWLVLSGVGERLRVGQPFEERLNAGRFEVAARLASQVTIVVGTRVEKNTMSGQVSKSLILQTALKTVN